jgi:mRNA interferase HigB
MHILSRPAIHDAQARYPIAAAWLDAWWSIASKAVWTNLADVRLTYRDADEVGQCLIFNACGNNYRLICRCSYANGWVNGTLLVKHFLTHAEYDKNKWRKDCKPRKEKR